MADAKTEAGGRFIIETTIRDKYGNIKSHVIEDLNEDEINK